MTTKTIRNYFKKEGWRISIDAFKKKKIELTQSEINEFIQGGLAMNKWSRFTPKEQVNLIRIYSEEFINKCAFKRGVMP